METTANYGLKKPEGTDTVNIDDLNYNADTLDKKIKEVETDITDLKNHVDNGKSSLYSAIVGKKVTPRSKDFVDLKNAINSIKLGQGNAQPSKVLKGATFTNDSGVVQEGTIPVMGSKDLTPKTYAQELGSGFYNKIKVKGFNDLDTDTLKGILKSILPKFKNNLIEIINEVIPNNDIPNFQYKYIKFDSVTLPRGQEDIRQNIYLNFKPKYVMIKYDYKDNGYDTNWRFYPIIESSRYQNICRIREDISISYSYTTIRYAYTDKHHDKYTFEPIEIFFFSDLPIK